MESKVIVFAAFLTSIMIVSIVLKDSGFNFPQTGNFAMNTGVGIIDQVEAVMYEESRQDNIFEIELNYSNESISYNGSYSSPTSGFDSFDSLTQTFTLENMGSTAIDVLITGEDFSNGTEMIQVDRDIGSLKIYIPGVGWKNIPDGSEDDYDGEKDLLELCIANDLAVGGKVAGIDFSVAGDASGNYLSRIRITAYNSNTSNPCNSIGEYAPPGN